VQSRARDFADGFVFAKRVKLCRLSSQLADSRRFGSSLFANFDVLPSNKAECSREQRYVSFGLPGTGLYYIKILSRSADPNTTGPLRSPAETGFATN
jgi:hypothetical protein